MSIRKVHIILLLFALTVFNINRLSATHNRAGEITLRQISDLSFEIKITTFTYTLSAADRRELDVQWGDNTVSTATRDTLQLLPNNYRRNVYLARHTYPGPGTYEIVVEDPNRNFGVKNIPGSVNVIFSIKTIITVNPSLGLNSTPVLLNPPIDKAALGQVFIHNPAAFDFDGDSISYGLTVCTKENGEPIENYTFPEASDTLRVDPITGDLIWDAPVDTGIYNIAMNIEEWRDGVKIGNIARDMQVEVYRTDNVPPSNDSIPDICVVAGDTIEFLIRSTDEDDDNLSHFLTGGPFAFDDNSARYEVISDVPGELISRFTWETSCLHPRRQPYSLVIKTEDHNPELSLIDIDNVSIKVLGPPPDTPVVRPSSVSARVSWAPYPCEDILGYNIYRKRGSSDYVYDSCSPGLPATTGYDLIGRTESHSDTSFLDNNNGSGLLQGIEYCYRITAILADGSESFPSEENCTSLVPGSPGMLQVSVTDNSTNGSILVSWAKPESLDTIPANGPYSYLIYRSDDLWGDNLQLIDSINTSDLNDTTYLDNGLNTNLFPYSYSVELYNDEPGNRFLVGKAEIASSTYPSIVAMDNELRLNIQRNVPWLNERYTIYRFNDNSAQYDSIGTTTEEFFIDEGLINGKEYCYYVVSDGQRQIDGKLYLNQNISHQNCGTPIDTIAPCPPLLDVQSACDSAFNQLDWFYTEAEEECSKDVVTYRIYYTSDLNNPHAVLDSLQGRDNNAYRHYPENGLAASYFITAIDSFGNESAPSAPVIVDNCIKYSIPNVFSPNGDGFNDILRPYEYQDVERVDMQIFNRWGQLIFQTDNPDLNWNGKHKDTDELVSPGVYYYICDVFERRITGVEVRNIVGFIHVFHEKGASNVDGEF
jgi:gliding motility-associated-like protein